MKTLLLDYNGSLTDARHFWKTKSTQAAQALGASWSKGFEDYFKLQFMKLVKSETSEPEFFDALAHALQVSTPVNASQRFRMHEQLLPSRIQDIQTLKQKFGSKLTIAILSNYFGPWISEQLQKSNLTRHIKTVITADKHHIWKPLPSAFERATHELGTPSQHIVYVSDTKADLGIAQKLGMKPVFIKGDETDRGSYPCISSLQELTKHL